MDKLGFIITLILTVHLREGQTAQQWNIDENRLELTQTRDDHLIPRQAALNHKEPKIIQPIQRNIYKSKEDPGTFYKNVVFKNLTEMEKNQLRLRRLEKENENSINEDLDFNNLNLRNIDGFTDNRKRILTRPFYRSRNEKSSRGLCIKCPAEQIAVAQKGREKVKLTVPKLLTCDGEDAPPNIHFKMMDRSFTGRLLTEGSHMTLAAIMYKDRIIQYCRFRYSVIVRRCSSIKASPDMVVHCPHNGAWGTRCRFKCSRPDVLARGGPPRITCEDDLQWSAPIPQCKESNRPWCETKPIARMGRITCETPLGRIHMSPDTLPEGSTCTVQCKKKPYFVQEVMPESKVVCQNGLWRGQIYECPKLKRDRRRKRYHQG